MKKFLFVSMLIFSLLASAVLAADALDITSGSISLSGNPGSTINSQFQLSNTGTTNLSISFDQLTLTSGSHALTIDNINAISLNSGANQQVSFTLSNTNVYAATYTGNLRAYKTGDTSVSDTVPVQVVINPSASASSTNPTIEVAQGYSKQTSFTVTNSGNTDLNSISMQVGTITDGTNVLPSNAISLSPSSISSLSHQGSSAVTVTVSPSATQATGTYSGPITLNYGSGTVQATLSVTVDTPEHKVEITDTEIKLGGSSQEREQTVQTTFTIKNTGDFTENSIQVQLEGVHSQYSASLSDTSTFGLSAGSQKTITLTATIPDDQTGGIETLGKIKITYASGSITEDVKLEVENMISIDDLEIKVGGEEDSNVGDNDKIDEAAKPGDEVEFDFEIKNLYSSSDDIKLEDIEIIVTIEGIDDGDDMEESTDIESIDENKKKSASVKFELPQKIDEGEYDVIIEIEGEDEDNALHIITWNLVLEAEKNSHDIQITKAELGTDTLKCMRSTNLRVTMANFGSRYERKAAMSVYNAALSINENYRDIELDDDYNDDDNEFSKTISINLADDFAAGTYPIEIRTYYNDDTEMDTSHVNLKVEACPITTQPADDNTQQDQNDVVVQTQPGFNQSSNTSTGSASNIVETVETSFADSGWFIIALLAANFLVLIVMLVLIFKFLI